MKDQVKVWYGTAVKCVVSFRDFLLGFLGLFCVVLAISMAVSDRLPAAGLLFTAGLLLSVFASLSRFEFIKGMGIDLKMREINEKVDHVEQLAEKVAKTSTVTAEFCMEVMSRIGRLSGPMPRDIALRLVRDMSMQLLSLNVDKAVVDRLLESWRGMVMFDLASPASKELHDGMERIRQGIHQLLREVPQPIDVNSDKYMEYLRRQDEAAPWGRRVEEIWRRVRGVEQIKSIDEVYKGLTEKYGKSIIANPEAAEESIRHAMHFVAHKDFLDEKYWIDADPLKAEFQLR